MDDLVRSLSSYISSTSRLLTSLVFCRAFPMRLLVPALCSLEKKKYLRSPDVAPVWFRWEARSGQRLLGCADISYLAPPYTLRIASFNDVSLCTLYYS